ncbi:MAG: hypothetical protein E7474_01470 [Ruminococcaceae bacterium]|nr:hypothetical protein [Oscillospiraceae bacterium]
MLQRWLVAIIGLPLLLGVLLACPAWATMLLVCAIAGVAAYELLHVAGKNVTKAVYGITVLFAAAQVMCLYKWDAGTEPMQLLFRGPLPLVVCLFFAAVLTYGKPEAIPFSTVSAGIVGGAVFPMMYACILLLRMQEPYGRVYVLAPFVIAFLGDSLSMYFGMWFGKKKMAPLVSPKKTWAGFWGGPLGSALGMLLLGFIGTKWLGYPANYPLLALAGVVGNLLGQLGDLSMSLIKREAGIKDYSHLFLTHGGMLDRFDSSLFIAPVVYFFVSIGMI